MTKTKILTIDGKSKGTIDLPKCFSEPVRNDVIAKVLEAQKIQQPYSPSPVAGKQASASGKLKHRRGVWKSQYKKGISRIPRKIMTRKGSQFNWIGATIPSARGGRRAHPPKILSMLNRLGMNKKEKLLALKSALSSTADKKSVEKRYGTIDKLDKDFPLVVESKMVGLKAKDLISSLKKVLGEKLFDLGVKKKSVRAGKGKRRGRKYKSTAGLLFVVGKKEKLKTGAFDVVSVNKLGVTDLAKGSPGRLTIYTEDAIRDLGERLK
ncbi:50S ribosomal protein L4 [Candidatus Pacearchaeota archaeon]|nr:50S ribosomal protein L4 [Candidatus Pacearchaeota archaeon]